MSLVKFLSLLTIFLPFIKAFTSGYTIESNPIELILLSIMSINIIMIINFINQNEY